MNANKPQDITWKEFYNNWATYFIPIDLNTISIDELCALVKSYIKKIGYRKLGQPLKGYVTTLNYIYNYNELTYYDKMVLAHSYEEGLLELDEIYGMIKSYIEDLMDEPEKHTGKTGSELSAELLQADKNHKDNCVIEYTIISSKIYKF